MTMGQTLIELLQAKYTGSGRLADLCSSIDNLAEHHGISLDELQDIVALLTWRGK